LQEEEARIKEESVFKARPLPITTLVRSQSGLVGEDLLPGTNKLTKRRSGKENGAFVPRSSIRAEERALYDAEKAVRERQRRQEQMEMRDKIIDQNMAEIKDLKKCIR